MTEIPIPVGAQYIGQGPQISRGLKRFTWGGQVVIANGAVTLYDDKQQVIDSAPLAAVELKESKAFMGTGFYLLMNGQKYSISWSKGSGGSGILGAVSFGLNLAQAHSPAQEFKQAYGAMGGRIAQ